MNVLDENILESQRQLLRNWGVQVRQIGFELGRKGMADEEIIPFLLTLFLPLDSIWNRRLFRRIRLWRGSLLLLLFVFALGWIQGRYRNAQASD